MFLKTNKSNNETNWIINLDHLPPIQFHPLEISRLLGVPRRETVALVVEISDAILGVYAVTSDIKSNHVQQYLEDIFSPPINRLMEEWINLEDYPEDLYHCIDTWKNRLRKGILDLAFMLLGRIPKGAKQLVYVYSMGGGTVFLRVTRDIEHEYPVIFRSQTHPSVLQSAS